MSLTKKVQTFDAAGNYTGESVIHANATVNPLFASAEPLPKHDKEADEVMLIDGKQVVQVGAKTKRAKLEAEKEAADKKQKADEAEKRAAEQTKAAQAAEDAADEAAALDDILKEAYAEEIKKRVAEIRKSKGKK